MCRDASREMLHIHVKAGTRWFTLKGSLPALAPIGTNPRDLSKIAWRPLNPRHRSRGYVLRISAALDDSRVTTNLFSIYDRGILVSSTATDSFVT